MLPASAELPMDLRDARPVTANGREAGPGHGNGHGNGQGSNRGPGTGEAPGVEVPARVRPASGRGAAAPAPVGSAGDRSVITIETTGTEATGQAATMAGASPQTAIRELREKAIAARQMGFTGDPCPSCQAMQLVRNGTCLKCMSCGATTGCS